MSIKKNYQYFIIISFLVISCKKETFYPYAFEGYISISFDKTPAVSHDGTLIAYAHNSLKNPEPANDPSGLYIMNSDGTNNRLLLKGYFYGLSWSPDDQWIVYSPQLGILQITNPEGDSIRIFRGLDSIPPILPQCPDWSPDGKSILFNDPLIRDGGFICSPDFTVLKKIYRRDTFPVTAIKWYSSSEYLGSMLFFKDRYYSSLEIFIADTAFINISRLTFSSDNNMEPSASPSHEYIAWNCNGRIYCMNKDGSYQIFLDYGKYPSWTPDSKYIIYSNANPDVTKGVIWRIGIDGKNKTQLTF